MTCATCHSVAPRLNTFGLAFQANFFNWPGGPAPKRGTGINAIPVSGLATANSLDNLSAGDTTTDFRTLQLLLTGGYGIGSQLRGGYLIDYFAVTKGFTAGELDDAYTAIPFGGRRGQVAVTIGQVAPMKYQYESLNRLTQARPLALVTSTDGFSVADSTPGVRLDYFNNRGMGTADGDYAALEVPFQGHIDATSDTQVHGSRGIFAHLFRRRGYSSLGVFGFAHAGNHLEGIMATREVRKDLFLLAVGNLGHDALGSSRSLSVETEYTAGSSLALTGRLEAVGGTTDDVYPVAAVTYYPFHQSYIRLLAQTTQARANRTLSFYVYGQF